MAVVLTPSNPATRTPHTAPVLDNSAFGLKEFSSVSAPIDHPYQDIQFNGILRFMLKAPVPFVAQMELVTVAALARLGQARNTRKVYMPIPNASDHFEYASWRDWCAGIVVGDTKSIYQLLTFDSLAATITGA